MSAKTTVDDFSEPKTEMEIVTNAPDASSLMLTARSFGNYDLAGALADLIDNSIKAKSRQIEIECSLLSNNDCQVRIRDDGDGMSAAELKSAMRPASSSPETERAEDDLGRFGWGMKSASFSQCRRLIVVSRKNGTNSAASWDLDEIDNWSMGFCSGSVADAFLETPLPGESGTELIWRNCDRLSENRTINREQFNEAIAEACSRISLIFHRYLSGDEGRSAKLRITVNGTQLDPVDPFCRNNEATIPYPAEPIRISRNNRNHTVLMKAFVLPHYSKLSSREYEEYGGREGYVRNQGFYVYRNRRLIISGTWFRLAKHGELSKLVRVQIDIPNALDDMWKITVDKSDAQLPAALKSRMKTLVDSFRSQSRKVIGSKGAPIDAGSTTQVWKKFVRHGRIRYTVNREHPMISTLQGELDQKGRALLKTLLEMVETQVPVDSINHEVSNSPHEIEQNFTSREELVTFLDASLPLLMSKSRSPDALKELLSQTEPFASHMKVVEEELHELLGH